MSIVFEQCTFDYFYEIKKVPHLKFVGKIRFGFLRLHLDVVGGFAELKVALHVNIECITNDYRRRMSHVLQL